jgi:HlyD family secretion protein
MKAAFLQSLPIPLACLGLGLMCMAGGCNRPDASPTGPKTSQGQAPDVTTVKPARKSIHHIIERPAFVEAFEETPLMAKIPGYVHKVHVDKGARVRGPRPEVADRLVQVAQALAPLRLSLAAIPLSLAGVLRDGQVLAELWVPEMEEELQQKKALVDQTEAELKLAYESVKAAEAEQNRQKSQLERFAKAGTEIFQGEILEETRLAYEVSKAKLGMAGAEVGVRKTRVEVAKAEQRRLSALLQYSKVRAPYDGVITSRNIHTGYYLTGTGAKSLFVIARMDIVRIMVDVPEVDAMSVSDGNPARIRCQMSKNHECTGTVARSSWSLDTKSRTLHTEIDVSNAQGHLRPGMYAYARIEAKLPEAWVLPAAALAKQGDLTYCYLVESGKAVRVPVQVGRGDGGFVEVLKRMQAKAWVDFTGNEEIIANPSASVGDGQAVRVTAPVKNK